MDDAPEAQAPVIQVYDVPPLNIVLPGTTPADMLAAAVDRLVEATARTMAYNGAAHCAGYAASTVPQWAAEAMAFIAWRDAVWLTIFAIDPENPPPSIEAALAMLPPFVRPGQE
jgi:hypothetical protein